ncbi:MAG: class I SAM-dependent methyltransferase [Verrucomicrobia bacterium]|nr:class I SAM-dependent methyltransferase [Verrucomicrobiota bacterium]
MDAKNIKDTYGNKSSVDQIRERFDREVGRFAELNTGQQSTMDAPLVMDLMARAALSSSPKAHKILDIGCGAGNHSLKLRMLSQIDLDITLVDLSQPMLDMAFQRLSEINHGNISLWQGDFRHFSAESEAYDIVLAAAVFHHLRDDNDWLSTFQKVFDLLASGGSIWISDLVTHDCQPVQNLMWERYAEYLIQLGGIGYQKHVFEYIDLEDSPRSLNYQIDLLRSVGFGTIEVLHKNCCFAAFGAVKP